MANTYTQNYTQFIFAVKYREMLIYEPLKTVIEKYICGIVKEIECVPYAIYCNPDHTHLLVSLNKTMSLAEFAKIVKSRSSKYINENVKLPFHFNWQIGYGAFSYSQSQIGFVIQYILNQEKHHQKQSFKDEYVGLLERFNVEYDERYLFDFFPPSD